MPRFIRQNKKRVDPRYFLNETKETWNKLGYDKETGNYGPRLNVGSKPSRREESIPINKLLLKVAREIFEMRGIGVEDLSDMQLHQEMVLALNRLKLKDSRINKEFGEEDWDPYLHDVEEVRKHLTL